MQIHCSIGFIIATIFVFLNELPSFPGIVRPIEWVPIHLPVEEVAMCAYREVFLEVDVNSALIVGDL